MRGAASAASSPCCAITGRQELREPIAAAQRLRPADPAAHDRKAPARIISGTVIELGDS